MEISTFEFHKFEFTIPGVEEHALVAPFEVGLAVVNNLVAQYAPHKINLPLNTETAKMIRKTVLSKIDAIKMIRAFSRCSLLEAKETYEYMYQVRSDHFRFRF